jgi:UDP:flavonoid glycosyltransferase YjiC (YdhE family)
MRVVLATIGSRGDVQPMLALAQSLRARGHVPVLAAPVNFEPWITSLGFEYAPLGRDMQVFMQEHPEMLTGNTREMGRGFLKYFNAELSDQAAQLAQACGGADALVYAGLALFSGASVASACGLPAINLQFTTCLLPSSAHPPTIVPWQGLPAWLNRLLWAMQHHAGNAAMLGTVNAMRAGLRLPPVRNVWTHWIDETALMIAADETVLPPDPQWGKRFTFANFLFFNDARALAPELDAWLVDGEPPVFVGFGSMSGAGPQRVERLLTDALMDNGRRCLLGAGWGGLGKLSLPGQWRVVGDVPHAQLFPRVAAVVHHGGSGTTAQALRAGVPQVVLPLLLDQFHHAHRLYLAGLAPKPVPMERVTAAQLRNAVEAALHLPAPPRMAVQERLRNSDAGADIVARLERLVLHHASPSA